MPDEPKLDNRMDPYYDASSPDAEDYVPLGDSLINAAKEPWGKTAHTMNMIADTRLAYNDSNIHRDERVVMKTARGYYAKIVLVPGQIPAAQKLEYVDKLIEATTWPTREVANTAMNRFLRNNQNYAPEVLPMEFVRVTIVRFIKEVR